MKRGKYEVKPAAKKSSGKKVVSLLLVLVLLLGAVVGTTLAWLVAKSETVTNTFTFGNIGITLTEENKGENYVFDMVPGKEYTKDPKVTVTADSEKCWLFVKVETTGDLSVLTYSVDTGEGKWTAVGGDGNDGVYYRVVDESENAQEFNILTDNKVSVNENVTAEQIAALNGTEHKLTFTAYAIQYDELGENVDAAGAWAMLQNQLNPPTED